MDVESVRDWVLIYAAILWGLITLLVAVIVAGLLYATQKGLGAARKLRPDTIQPMLQQAQGSLNLIRDRTSLLPGNQPVIEGEARPATPRLPFRLPFGRKKKRRFGILPR
jgi:hypothetical protein